MNIIVSPGLGSSIISFGNMGDISMLQAGLGRLAKTWPGASLKVLTEWPENLVHFCPEAIPVQAVGRNLWVGEDILLGRFTKFVPKPVRQVIVKSKRTASLRFPTTARWCLNTALRIQNRRAKSEAVSAFSDVIASTDLVVVCGAGGFYEGKGCRDWNMTTLDIIEAAVQRGIPAAMFGQHFGPLINPEVLRRAKRILPAVDLITLRGQAAAKSFLESLGVAASRIRITGDEAVELAHAARPQNFGGGLGVNFRLRASAETNDCDIEKLRPILQGFARQHQIPLIPAPIAVDPWTSDYSAIQQLLKGFDDGSDGGATLRSPCDIIRQIGRCRALVTCAYHAAVFALAQGIPVVALARSSYFVNKFQGLKERFGVGCEIVYLDRPDASQTFYDVLERVWKVAEEVHVPLKQSAVRQIQSVWNAYDHLKELVNNRVKTPPGP